MQPGNTLTNPQLEYVLEDHQGSTHAVLNAAGSVLERAYYDPFGQRLDLAGQWAPTLGDVRDGHTGHEMEDATGFIDRHGRLYDPKLKTFASAAPLVVNTGFSQSWGPYSYVMNSPQIYTDPSGFAPSLTWVEQYCLSNPGACMSSIGSGGGGSDGSAAYGFVGRSNSHGIGGEGQNSTDGGGGDSLRTPHTQPGDCYFNGSCEKVNPASRGLMGEVDYSREPVDLRAGLPDALGI